MIPSFNADYWQDKRETLIKEKIKLSLSNGQRHDPFSSRNFTETLQNLNYSDYWDLCLALSKANISGNIEDKITLSNLLLRIMSDYWIRLATYQAEEDTVSAYELYIDEINFNKPKGE